MAENNTTIFQRLTQVFGGGSAIPESPVKKINSYGFSGTEPIFTTKDRAEYEKKKLELRQQNLLAKQWIKANQEISTDSLIGLSETRIMFRDADLMDAFPEIGAALDIVSEEVCQVGKNGSLVNVYSKSDRIKAILEDLLVNRLSITTNLPLVARATCKYGNEYMLLNIDANKGILGWRRLPVYEMERYDTKDDNPYAKQMASKTNVYERGDETVFVWVGKNSFVPYRNWQVAHFRLLYDSLFLPYGMSFLNKGRRHFRMLSLMEDMMLLYRLERSVERRVFKVDVGSIDEQDVPSYVQQIADNFKRTPLIDQATGQLDLRKNILNNSEDFFIPTRDPNSPNPIETLPAAQNLTALDDIKYVQNKLFTALRVPKPFLNFEENAGDGKNLSLLDVRFTRTVNRIQQMLLMELNKICVIHLYLLGFTDELTNFTLTMNNPSSQAEMLELENMSKKISVIRDAVSDPGPGIPIMSMTNAWKTIMGWSDREVSENLDQLRLEKALANELEKTPEIIKNTGLFKFVDNLYGEPGAKYSDQNGANGGEEGPAPGGGGGGGFDFGGGMPDMEGGEGDMTGNEGEIPTEEGAQEEAELGGGPQPETPTGGETEPPVGENLATRATKPLLYENNKKNPLHIINEGTLLEKATIYDKNFIINEELNKIACNLKNLVNDKTVTEKEVNKTVKKLKKENPKARKKK